MSAQQPEPNLVAAWRRALDRGRALLADGITAEDCAERYPEYNAQELCAQATTIAFREEADCVGFEHFDAAAEAIDDADDPLDGDVQAESSARGPSAAELEARVEDLEDQVASLRSDLGTIKAALRTAYDVDRDAPITHLVEAAQGGERDVE